MLRRNPGFKHAQRPTGARAAPEKRCMMLGTCCSVRPAGSSAQCPACWEEHPLSSARAAPFPCIPGSQRDPEVQSSCSPAASPCKEKGPAVSAGQPGRAPHGGRRQPYVQDAGVLTKRQLPVASRQSKGCVQATQTRSWGPLLGTELLQTRSSQLQAWVHSRRPPTSTCREPGCSGHPAAPAGLQGGRESHCPLCVVTGPAHAGP